MYWRRFDLNPVVKLFLGHQGHLHRLDDHRMAGNRSGHILRLGLLRIEDRDDLLGDGRGVHDGAIDDRVLGQRFQAKADQFVAVLGLLQLDGFYGAGADVQADQ